MSNELLLTVPEAMARIRVGRSTMYRLLGVAFPMIKIGRATRVPAGPLDAWASSQYTMRESATVADKSPSGDNTGVGAGAGL